MATLADLIKKQRTKGEGVFSSLSTAIGQKTLEKIDPRRLINQRGLLTSLFPSLRAYKPGGTTSRVADSSMSLTTQPILQEASIKLDIVGKNTQITAKNTMSLPLMARDMNIMRQNVVKLVKLQGGQASTRADAFFLRAREREASYESQFARTSSTAPTSVTKTEKSTKDRGFDFFSVITAISVAIKAIPNLIMKGLSGLTDLLKGGIKIGFDLAKGAVSIAGARLKGLGMSVFSIIRALASFLVGSGGLAALGVGLPAALLTYLLTNEKTKYGTSVEGATPEDTTFTPPSPGASNLSDVKDEEKKLQQMPEFERTISQLKRDEGLFNQGQKFNDLQLQGYAQRSEAAAAAVEQYKRERDMGSTAPIRENGGISQQLLDKIKTLEGFSAKAYWDHKQWSIGYGTKANSPDEVIDEKEAERRLIADLERRQKYVIDFAKSHNYNWSQNQLDALTSFIYNLGEGALNQVTAGGTRTNEEIMRKIPEYNKASGEVNKGLVSRRQTELAMFAGAGAAGAVVSQPILTPATPSSGIQVASASSAVESTRMQQSAAPITVVAPTTIQQSGSTPKQQPQPNIPSTIDEELFAALMDRTVSFT